MTTRTADRTWILVFAVAGLVLAGGLRWGAGLWGATGTDAPLWGLSARDLAVGAPPLVPPLYPALIGVLHTLGLGLVEAGQGLAALGAALVPPAVFWAARSAGAAPAPAVGAALLALAMPDLGAWSQQLQPDSLAALGLVLSAGALARHHRSPSSRTALLLVVLAGLLPLLREHGVAVAAVIILGLTVLPRRRGWALAAVGAWWLAPLLLGLPPGLHPLDTPWGDRAGGALAALTSRSPDELPYLRELHRGARRAYLALVAEGDVVGRLRWHAGRSLALATDGWLVLGLAAVGVSLQRRTRGLAAPLLAALPALLIWSQRRHVLLLLPVALAVLAAALPAGDQPRARWTPAAAAVGLAALLTVLLPRWPGTVAGLQSERPRAEHYAQIGGWICENTPPTVLLGGVFQDVGLYCPRPRHDPDGTTADWHTAVVADHPPAPVTGGSWAAVFQGDGELRVYRLQPDGGGPLPCPAGRPAPSTPHLAVAAAHAEWIGCPPTGP